MNNVVDGGTIFFINNKKELIKNKYNRLVVFDIRLLHKSQVFKKGVIKKTIGFRIKIKILFFFYYIFLYSSGISLG